MSLKEKFIFNFIDDGRWHYIVDGLKVTLEVTFFAVLLGIALGVIIAFALHTIKTKARRAASVNLLWFC